MADNTNNSPEKEPEKTPESATEKKTTPSQDAETAKKASEHAEQQADADSSKTQIETNKLLKSLEEGVVSSEYGKETKEKMIKLRDELKSGDIDVEDANKEAKKLLKKKESQDTESEEELTLWQKFQKKTLPMILPFGIGSMLAKGIKPKEKKSDEKKPSFFWRALKWTGIVGLGIWGASKLKNMSKKESWKNIWQDVQDFFSNKESKISEEEKKLQEDPRWNNFSKALLSKWATEMKGGKENGNFTWKNADKPSEDGTYYFIKDKYLGTDQQKYNELMGTNINIHDDGTDKADQFNTDNTNNSEVVSSELSLDQVKAKLQKSYPKFDDIFLSTRAGAIVAGETSFEHEGKRYYILERPNQEWGITADYAKYEESLAQQSGEQLSADNETLTPEQEKQSEEANQEAEKLVGEGHTELYILTRMYQKGFIPKKAFGGGWLFRPFNAVFDSQRNMAVWLKERIPSYKNKLLLQKAEIIKNTSVSDFDERMKILTNIDTDLKKGNIKNMKELSTKYGSVIENKLGKFPRLRSNKFKLEKTGKNLTTEIEKIKNNETAIREADKKFDELKKNTTNKLEELRKLSEKETNPQKQKQLLQEIQKHVDDYNGQSKQYQTLVGERLQGLSSADVARLEHQSHIVKLLSKSNGGAMGVISKVNQKGGKAMLGIAVFSLAYKGVGEVVSQGILSEETAWDAADLGAGLVPVAGGIYDIWRAIEGTDLNGRQLSTADRWIRAGIGAGTTVLDLFSWGLAGTAVRAGIKGAEATAKVVKTVKQVEKGGELAIEGAKIAKQAGGIARVGKVVNGVRLGVELMSFSALGYGLYEGVKEITVPAGNYAKHTYDVATTKPTDI